MTSPFKTFLSCINKHTLSQAGEFLFPNSTKDLIRLQKLFSPVLWPDECLVIFLQSSDQHCHQSFETHGSTSILYDLFIIENKHLWAEDDTV